LIPPLEAAFGSGPARATKATDTLSALQKLDHHLAAAEQIEDLVAAVQAPDLDACMSRLSQWSKDHFQVNELKYLGEDSPPVVAEHCAAIYEWLKSWKKIDPDVLRCACQALHFLVSRVRDVLRTRGVQTFEDLLQNTRALLAGNESVRRRVRSTMDQLLVDEFQDTDPVQCEILRLLALDGEPSQRPGLFLVGDPKQSIYGWRNADLAAYEGFVEAACQAGGARHYLTVNFRSAPAVLDEVHRLISPLMHYQAGLQPHYRRLVPSPAKQDDPGHVDDTRRPVEHWISWDVVGEGEEERKCGFETRSDTAREIEAEAIARDMAELAAQGASWRQMALLLRASTKQHVYLQAMREHGVPYVVERDRTFYQHREVIDAASLLRAVGDPNDQVALVGFLRSPWVGVPDAAWLPLWAVQFPQKMGDLHGPDQAQLEDLRAAVDQAARQLPPDVPGMEALERWPMCLHAAVRALAELRHSFRADPADVFVDKLQALPLVTEVESARFLASHRLANLDRFFRGVRDALADGEGGPQMVLRALREGVAGERLEEVGPPGDETLDAVRILTMHVSKGLEFEHVYVANLHRNPGHGFHADDAQVARHGGRWELSLFGSRSLGFHRVEDRARRVGATEEIRTFYVAATRAARRLVLAGCWPDPGKDPEGPFPDREQPFVEFLQHRKGKRPDLALHLGAVAAGGDEDRVDGDGVRWRIPRRSGQAPSRRGSKKAASPVSLESARADLQQLEAAREQAAQRMRRPLAAAASRKAHQEPEEDREDDSAAAEARRFASVDRAGAMAVGRAVHRALEILSLDGDPAKALRQQRKDAANLVPPGERSKNVLRKVDELLGALESSDLLLRLGTLAPHILGREVPFLAAGAEDEGPVGACIGTMDLLYRDPEDGALVVADYKTDAVESDDELEARTDAYRAQGQVYADAVRRFLDEPCDVRFELWFLAAGRVVNVEL
jgi:ATP-dependent helicase/nuclease subunit A